MRNIFGIFVEDLRTIGNNVIALIVVIGIVVIPSLYAWFNIEASWDPYSKTKDIRVAITNEDRGYKGDLIPAELNIGDKTLSSLRANNQLQWTFVPKKDALDGVRSGRYYAAIIIPADFSKDMMSLFSEDIRHSKIEYYYNEKKNAIAPKVTDKGAEAIQMEINRVFVSTVSDAIISSLKFVDNTGRNIDARYMSESILEKLEDYSERLSLTADTIEAFKGLSTSANNILNMTSFISGKKQEDAVIGSLKKINSDIEGLETSILDSGEELGASFDGVDKFYGDIRKSTSSILSGMSSDNKELIDYFETQAKKIDSITKGYEEVVSSLTIIKEDPGTSPLLRRNIEGMIAGLKTSIRLNNRLYKEMNSTVKKLKNSSGNIEGDIKSINNLIAQSQRNMDSISNTYKRDVRGKLTKLSSSIILTNTELMGLLEDFGQDCEILEGNNKRSKKSLSSVSNSLKSSERILRRSADSIDNLCKKIRDVEDGGDYKALERLLTDSKVDLGKFISAPVKLKTKEVYSVENYGSAMAPFYSALAIWVGGIVLVAIMKVDTGKKYRGLRHSERYFGRYILFLLLGLLQTSLIMLGDLYFLEIQCLHPFEFLIVGWITSIVFVNIIYTLTISFGDVGKAISVILLVIQVAGTGGTFPIECAPPLFRKVYPLLPFTHSMNAMRECICGFYKDNYIKSIIALLCFLIPSLFLGLVLRKPVISLNKLFMDKLEDTKIM